MTIQNSCIVCGNSNLSPFVSCTDHFVSEEQFSIAKCSNCSFKFTQDAPPVNKIAPYYHSEDYISHSNTQKGLVNTLYHTVREIMLKKKYRLITRLTPGKKLLDIGCGTGYFPYFMNKQGYEASGMEIEPEARKFAAKNFNLEIQSPDELLNKQVIKTYDVITLWHVLEHLYDSEGYLTWIKEALKDEGVLLIALPNCNSYDAKIYRQFWAAYDVPRHLWHFEPKTFEQYIKKFGLELTAIKRLPFDAYYNSIMSAKYAKKPVSLIHGAIVGFISNFKSFFNIKAGSSIIYIVKKPTL